MEAKNNASVSTAIVNALYRIVQEALTNISKYAQATMVKVEIETRPKMKLEQQVLQLIASGATNREITEHLVVTEGTVKTHVTHLLSRLDCRNRAQLAIIANSVFGIN